MKEFIVKTIGTIKIEGENTVLALEKEYAPALDGLLGFSHVNVLWWFSGCDNERDRGSVAETSPYKGAPERLGTFATRSPMRPNPIALSCAGITYIDRERATVGLTYIDAEDGTPLLDIKPYTPSLDRVEDAAVPEWCAGWPKSLEESGDFDWESVFQF